MIPGAVHGTILNVSVAPGCTSRPFGSPGSLQAGQRARRSPCAAARVEPLRERIEESRVAGHDREADLQGLEHREGPDREHAAWDDLATASMSPALLYLFGRSAGRSSPRPCLPRRRRSPSRQRRLPMRRHAWVDGARPTRQHPQAGSIVRGRCAQGRQPHGHSSLGVARPRDQLVCQGSERRDRVSRSADQRPGCGAGRWAQVRWA